MLKLTHEQRGGTPEPGAPTLRHVLEQIRHGTGDWRMMLELDGDTDFSRNTWYVDVKKLWLSGDCAQGKIWPASCWLEDFPVMRKKSTVRSAVLSGKLAPAILLHNGKTGFRIPVTVSLDPARSLGKPETVFDLPLGMYFGDRALPLCMLDANLEDWVISKRGPLRMAD